MQTAPRTVSAVTRRWAWRGQAGKLLIVALAVIAILSLVAAPVSVLVISRIESGQIFFEKLKDSDVRHEFQLEKIRAHERAEALRGVVPWARMTGLSKAQAEEQLMDAYEQGLPQGRTARLLRLSPSETARLLAADADYASPEEIALVAAWQQYGRECLRQLDRTYARPTASPQVPDALVAAEQRVGTAIDSWERAETLPRKRKAVEAVRQIRQKYTPRKIDTAAAFVTAGLLAAATTRTLTRRRRVGTLPSGDATDPATSGARP